MKHLLCLSISIAIAFAAFYDHTPSNICKEDQYTCTNGSCISITLKCDKKNDCADGDDEDFCDGPVTKDHCDPKTSFRCVDSDYCLPLHLRCDGDSNCQDDSDEIGCVKVFEEGGYCEINRKLAFLCKSDMKCIPKSQHCDRNVDCADGSDETLCTIIPDCPPGMTHEPNATCTDVDECTLGIDKCTQKCKNERGSYTCSCAEGYKLLSDNVTCMLSGANSGPTFMIVQNKREIIEIHDGKVSSLYNTTSDVFELDFDGSNYYWSNSSNEDINIVKMSKDGRKVEIFLDTGVARIGGLAVDWVTGNVYFTDYEFKRIAACTGSGLHCTILIEENTDKPNNIVLDPINGNMYWNEIGRNPAIMRASMDGSEHKSFVEESLKLPRGLTIDLFGERLYWSDWHYSHLMSIRLDGSGRRVIPGIKIHKVQWVGVFANQLYWNEMGMATFNSANKVTGGNVKIVANATLSGLRIYHDSLYKRTTNVCARNKCSHICLIKDRVNHTCACPVNMRLNNDGTSCSGEENDDYLLIGGGKALVKSNVPKLGKFQTKKTHLAIGSIAALAYNRVDDLVYIADAYKKEIVSLDMKQFDKGYITVVHSRDIKVIEGLAYDYIANNLYWTDSGKRTVEVLHIPTGKSTIVHFFHQETPRSIAIAVEYNKLFIHLQGRISEVACLTLQGTDMEPYYNLSFYDRMSTHNPLTYNPEQKKLYVAEPEIRSITAFDLSTHQAHELLRTAVDTKSLASVGTNIFWTSDYSSDLFYFYTDHKLSKFSSWRKKLDEFSGRSTHLYLTSMSKAKESNMSHPCRTGKHHCDQICVQSSAQPSGYACLCSMDDILQKDGSCLPRVKCDKGSFHCYEGNTCILKNKVCNKIDDCKFGEDERVCDHTRKSTTESSLWFRCDDGERIERHQRCDGEKECFDGSDERGCKEEEKHCKTDYWRCNDGECILKSEVCDTINDCHDKSDEKYDMCRWRTCDSSEFRCDSGKCIQDTFVCDGEADCPDSSDEHARCIDNSTKCREDQFFCPYGVGCLPISVKCDGKPDCHDFSDEADCIIEPDIEVSHSECAEYACPTDRSICLPYSAKCNKIEECPGGVDEMVCPRPCEWDEFQCKFDQICISKYSLCDDKPDCSDASDEWPAACSLKKLDSWRPELLNMKCENQFMCTSGICLDLHKACDYQLNCDDGSDEGPMCDNACKDHKCQHRCQPTPRGPACQCDVGYTLSSDNSTCQDIDECAQVTTPCTQICRNTEGSYECRCYEGFSLRVNARTCKAYGKPAEIMYLDHTSIRAFEVHSDKRKYVLFNKNVYMITSIDVHYGAMKIYFTSDYKLFIHDLNRGVTTYAFDMGRPSKVVVDWVTGNVYVVDPYNAMIIVCNTSKHMCAKVADIRVKSQLISVAIDPVNPGYLFYCARLKTDSQIILVRMLLSGQGSTEILHNELRSCGGLAVDTHKRVLFVAEMSHHDYANIYQVDYDGRNKKTLEISTKYKLQPREMRFFEDELYIMHSDNNFNLTRCPVNSIYDKYCHTNTLEGFSAGFAIFQEMVERPKSKNVCANITCEGVCVQSGSKHECLGNANDKNSLMVLFSDNEEHLALLRSRRTFTTSVIIAVILFLIITPCIYRRFFAARSSDRMPVHFQNQVSSDDFQTIQDPIVTISPPPSRERPASHGFTNPMIGLPASVMRAFRHGRRINTQERRNQLAAVQMELPDQDSDTESDRVDTSDRAKLVLI